MGFPLYVNLIKNINKKDLNIKQKQEFMKFVKIIDKNGSELIYVLIRTYYKNNDQKDIKIIENLPYNGIINKTNNKDYKNITWNFNQFPNSLKQLLYKFVIMNFKKNNEEIDRKLEN